ncbi:MAG: hypothetical protein GXP48_06320 [Acidobacteria bacterium]|nr:hypothetical protein [Acidobacteriota bacterium]
MAAVLVILTIVAFVAVDAMHLWLKRRSAEAVTGVAPVKAFAGVRVPRGLFLDDAHSWARLTESGELNVGVDEFLTQALGGADRVDLPEPGTRVERGQTLATVWRQGRKLEVAAPVSGRVVATNETVAYHPESVEADPYGSGWLARLWPVDHAEALKGLRVGERAAKWLEREVQRFAEFLSQKTSPELVGVMLPDGAHPVVGAALNLDDAAWQEFQDQFARNSQS